MTRERQINDLPDPATKVSRQAPVSWHVQMTARFDLVIHAHPTAALCVSFVAMIIAALPFVATVTWTYSLDPRLGVAAFVIASFVGSFSVIGIAGWLHDRLHVRPASLPAQFAMYSLIGSRHSEFVDGKAISFRADMPQRDVTIAMLLNWYDETCKMNGDTDSPLAADSRIVRSATET